jgi:uroporphyrinogen-III decarboxylase
MTEFFEDLSIEPDEEALRKLKQQLDEIGQDSFTATGIGESPLMYFIEWLAGVENAHYFLMDNQEEVERLFAVMHDVLVRRTRLLCEHNPVDAFYLIENTSTTLISPAQYRQYCVPQVGEYARIIEDAGRNLIIHMCGHLKGILPDLARIPAQAFEAFTSPTVGNTTLLDGRTACPGKCLIGGTNAVLWLKTPKEIIAKIEQDLDALPHHRGIVVTSSGVMPPMCVPETIREICEWVKSYPAIMSSGPSV